MQRTTHKTKRHTKCLSILKAVLTMLNLPVCFLLVYQRTTCSGRILPQYSVISLALSSSRQQSSTARSSFYTTFHTAMLRLLSRLFSLLWASRPVALGSPSFLDRFFGHLLLRSLCFAGSAGFPGQHSNIFVFVLIPFV